ncbi:hypothetical protein C2I36_10080 [Rhodobacteraceae bacterium WD3A24]|nr:hypothetical protein C2I36_10080 [Rhodobacteraceae bacterium WD3A24]
MARDPFDDPSIVPLSRSDRDGDGEPRSCFYPAAAHGDRPVPERAWLVPDLVPKGGSLIPLPPGTDVRFSNPTENKAYARHRGGRAGLLG